MSFEYTLSGMNYTIGVQYLDIPEVRDLYHKFFTEKCHGITMSCLYNAYTEKNLGDKLKNQIGAPKVYADSGGLQMALYGKAITKETRMDIYEVQQQYADIAFCFDDIPLEMVGDVSSSSVRSAVDNKFFNRSKLDEKAKNTARNIKEQIAHFKSKGAKTKIFAIIQGNCADTFTEWGNILFDEMTDDELDYIHGMALADTCAGNGMLETFHMIQAVHRIDCPEHIKKNLHFLGIGSIARLMPVMELSHTPILKGKVISFDSTTHTASIVMGRYFDADTMKMMKTGKFLNQDTHDQIEDVLSIWFPDHPNREAMKTVILNNLGTIKHLSHEDNSHLQSELVCFCLAYNFEMISRFAKGIEACYNDYEAYGRYIRDNKMIARLSRLRHLENNNDLNNWIQGTQVYIPSKAILGKKPSTLEGLF